MDSIGVGRGGLTRSVFDRFSSLATDRQAILATVSYQPNVRSIFNRLLADGALPKHTQLLNYFEDQRSVSRSLLPPIDEPHKYWEVGSPFQPVLEHSGSGRTVRYFHRGLFVGLTYESDNGVLRHVDHHRTDAPWIRDYRDVCWTDGSVGRREYYDEQGRVRFRVYAGLDARAYLSVWVNEKGYEYRAVEHTPTESFLHGDTRAANSAWLERRLQPLGPCVVYNDEPRTTFALAVDLPDVKHVASIHTTHRKDSGDINSGVKHWVDSYLYNRSNISNLVFFTEAQRSEFVCDTSFPEESTRVISHPAPQIESLEQSHIQRQPLLLVSVSRLAEDKRIGDAIRAFELVKATVPEARFEIWGTGPARGKLQALIEDLGLEDSVSLEGLTDDPLRQFARASLSVVTSKFEGFGLVLLESFACGTPVVAYEVNYGPREVVTDRNGRLVPDADMSSLATAIQELLIVGDGGVRDEARDTARHYSRIEWADRWEATLA